MFLVFGWETLTFPLKHNDLKKLVLYFQQKPIPVCF